MREVKRLIGLWFAVAGLNLASAQQPTVFFGAHLHSQVRADSQTTRWNWYDDLARHSVAFLQIYLEPGYGAYIAQRLQNVAGDRTRTALDEAYVERIGGWRVGKFYAPFGAGTLLNESVVAVQSPTQFAIANLPMRVAYLFNGDDRQQGVYVRVGTENGGASVGVGRHFATDPHALAVLFLPERRRDPKGYELLYGADWRPPLMERAIQLEWVYGEGKGMPTTHWFSLAWQMKDLPYQPELRLAYQTAGEQLSWRLSLQRGLAERLALSLVVRGNQDELQFVAVGLRGEL
ncbi:MAG: hypothetical protein SNJ72_03540 [Fimbriimonadales bacterium]